MQTIVAKINNLSQIFHIFFLIKLLILHFKMSNNNSTNSASSMFQFLRLSKFHLFQVNGYQTIIITMNKKGMIRQSYFMDHFKILIQH